MKWIILALLITGIVFGSGDHIAEGKELYDSNISCSELTDDQLELIGDYIMELMHPGEQHELMDRMMGGEGSESLRAAHINMAQRFYCNDARYGMMGGMMSYGMMGNQPILSGGYGMGYQQGYSLVDILVIILLIALIILVIILIVKNIRK